MNKKEVADTYRRDLQQFALAWQIQCELIKDKLHKQPGANIKTRFEDKCVTMNAHINKAEKCINDLQSCENGSFATMRNRVDTIINVCKDLYGEIVKTF